MQPQVIGRIKSLTAELDFNQLFQDILISYELSFDVRRLMGKKYNKAVKEFCQEFFQFLLLKVYQCKLEERSFKV